MDIFVKNAKMSRKDFISSFTDNETNPEWLDQYLNAGNPYTAALKEHEKEIRKAQKTWLISKPNMA